MTQNRPSPPQAISPQQVKLIHILKNARKLCDEDYYNMLMRDFGVSTSKLLTAQQAAQLITALGGTNKKRQAKRAPPRAQKAKKRQQSINDNIICLITPPQADLIKALCAEIEWGTLTYEAWLGKYFSFARPTTSRQARDVIEGLKNLKRNLNHKKK